MNVDLSGLHVSPLTLMGGVLIVGLYAGYLARKVRLPSLIGYMILGIVLGPSVFHLFSERSLDGLGFCNRDCPRVCGIQHRFGAECDVVAAARRRHRDHHFRGVPDGFCDGIGSCVPPHAQTLPLACGIWGDGARECARGHRGGDPRNQGSRQPDEGALRGWSGSMTVWPLSFSGSAAALAKSLLTGEATGHMESLLPALGAPLLEIGLSLVVGAVIGFGFRELVRRMNASSEVLVVVFGAILVATGLSVRWHLSLILTNMVVGFVLVNTTRSAVIHRVTNSMSDVMPLLFILFFCLAGAHLHIGALPSLGVLGIVYIIARSAGLILGARLGATMGHVEAKIKKYVGFGILSQAGVAIGLSLIVKHEFDQLATEFNVSHPAEIGATGAHDRNGHVRLLRDRWPHLHADCSAQGRGRSRNPRAGPIRRPTSAARPARAGEFDNTARRH